MIKKFMSSSGNMYFYDSITNNFIEVNDIEYYSFLEEETSTDIIKKINLKFWKKHIKSNEIDLELKTQKKDFGINPEILIFELTQQCNFRCEYCIYSGEYTNERMHQDISMSYEVIDQIFDKFINSRDSRVKYISFYGGEAFLEFRKIMYILEKASNKNIIYSITTNGNMLKNEKILNFCIKNNIKLNISFDGINNFYRKKSDGMDSTAETLEIIDNIFRNYKEYYKKNISYAVTLTPPFDLIKNSLFFSKKYFSDVNINISMIIEEDNAFFKNFDIENEQKKLDLDFKVLSSEYIGGNSNSFVKSIFEKSIYGIENRENSIIKYNHPLGNCRIGKHRLFITAEGEIRICERVNEEGRMGNINSDSYINQQCEDKLCEYYKNCKDCWAIRFCELCFASFNRNQGELSELCKIERKWIEKMIKIYLDIEELSEVENCK